LRDSGEKDRQSDDAISGGCGLEFELKTQEEGVEAIPRQSWDRLEPDSQRKDMRPWLGISNSPSPRIGHAVSRADDVARTHAVPASGGSPRDIQRVNWITMETFENP